MNQLFSTTYGNSNLKPEESKQWEGGFEGLTGPVTRRVSASAVTSINLIDSDPVSYRYYNIGKAPLGRRGHRFFRNRSVDASDWLRLCRPAMLTNEWLLRRAKQQVKYELDWQLYDFDWAVTYQYLERYDRIMAFIQARRLNLAVWSLWISQFRIRSHLI